MAPSSPCAEVVPMWSHHCWVPTKVQRFGVSQSIGEVTDGSLPSSSVSFVALLCIELPSFIISTQSRNKSAELLRSRPGVACRFNTSTRDLPSVPASVLNARREVVHSGGTNCKPGNPFHAD